MITKELFPDQSTKKGSELNKDYITTLGNSVNPDEDLYPALLRKINWDDIKEPDGIKLEKELLEFFNNEYELVYIKESEFDQYQQVQSALLQREGTIPVVEFKSEDNGKK